MNSFTRVHRDWILPTLVMCRKTWSSSPAGEILTPLTPEITLRKSSKIFRAGASPPPRPRRTAREPGPDQCGLETAHGRKLRSDGLSTFHDLTHPDLHRSRHPLHLMGEGLKAPAWSKRIKEKEGLVDSVYTYAYTPRNPGGVRHAVSRPAKKRFNGPPRRSSRRFSTSIKDRIAHGNELSPRPAHQYQKRCMVPDVLKRWRTRPKIRIFRNHRRRLLFRSQILPEDRRGWTPIPFMRWQKILSARGLGYGRASPSDAQLSELCSLGRGYSLEDLGPRHQKRKSRTKKR